MAFPREQGRKRRPWDVTRAIGSLEQEVYDIDPALTDPAERAIDRVQAISRLEAKCRQVVAGRRKRDAEIEKYERIAPAIRALQSLEEHRHDRRELLVRMAALAERTLPTVLEVLARFEAAFEPLKAMGEIQSQIEDDRHATAPIAKTLFEAPHRVRTALNQLVGDIAMLSTEPLKGYTPVAQRLEKVRRSLIGELRALGYPQSRIAELVDPEGYEEDKAHATDRIRKELERQRKDAQPAVGEGESPALGEEDLGGSLLPS